MLVKFTKEQSAFIKGIGGAQYIYGKNEQWYYIPFWFKATKEDCVFEQMSFDSLPEYLKEAITKYRGGFDGPINTEIKYPLTEEDADNKN